MAGIGKGAVAVDVVAAARQLIQQKTPWDDPAHDVLGDVQEVMREAERKATDVFGQVLVQCGLGHEQPPAGRFCSVCGLPMDAPPPPGLSAAEERPKPASLLSEQEREERNRQHAEALAANLQADELTPDITRQEDPSEQKLRIHFVEDGFTWGGKVWQIGEELVIGPDHPRWSSAVMWITMGKVDQVQRYGRVFFEPGPWPYHQLPPGTEIPLPEVNPRRVFESRRNYGVPARAGEDDSLVPL